MSHFEIEVRLPDGNVGKATVEAKSHEEAKKAGAAYGTVLSTRKMDVEV